MSLIDRPIVSRQKRGLAMNKILTAFLCFFFFLSLGASSTAAAGGQKAKPAAKHAEIKPDGQKAMEHINYLGSDELQGRRSGTPEYRKAAEYVAAKFQEYGLRPAGDNGTWFQEVPIKDWKVFSQPVRLEMTAPQHRVYFAGRGRDFQPLSGTGSGIVKGRMAFAGYGVISEKAKWNDYEGLDVKGRVVMVLPGAPASADADESKEWTLEKKIQIAADNGAVGLIEMDLSVPGRSLKTVPKPSDPIRKKDGCPAGFVVMRAGRGFCDDAFYAVGKSWKYPVSAMMREKKPYPMAIETAVEMEAHFVWEDRTAPNVVGVLPGTDAKLKNECIVFGGHLDHVGVGMDGFICNGADDDATSAATIIEVLRVMKANNFKPKRTLVIGAWMGEELGLRGSGWYTDHPAFPLEKTAIYVNIDMVGTGDSDLWVGGMMEFSDLYDIVREGLEPDIQAKLHPRNYYRGSDHSSFLKKGVPWISLRTGNPLTRELDDEHPEYHLAGDRPEYIRPELMELAARYHYQALTHLANTNKTLLDPMFFTRFIHRDANVVDTHCDTISRYLAGEDLTKDLPKGHIDIPKLKKGSVDLQVFACYVAPPQNETEKITAAKRAFDQIDGVHRFIADNPNDLGLVLTPGDLAFHKNAGRVGILIGIEGGYAIENDLSLLRAFYKSGVRLMTLTHWTRTDWADASGDEKPELGGLTEFGEKVVKEMNKLGMVIDVSHVHDETFWDVIKISEQPVVASHSCCRDISDHFRNLTDDMLKALAKNGGVIGINFAPDFLNAELGKKREAAAVEIAKKYGMPEDFRLWASADPRKREKALAELKVKTAEIEKAMGPVTVKTVVDHIDHVVRVTGSADNVGLGSDYDGIGDPPKGLENIGKIMAITEELKARGYKEEDIRKILGENFLRVFKRVTGTPAAKQMETEINL